MYQLKLLLFVFFSFCYLDLEVLVDTNLHFTMKSTSYQGPVQYLLHFHTKTILSLLVLKKMDNVCHIYMDILQFLTHEERAL